MSHPGRDQDSRLVFTSHIPHPTPALHAALSQPHACTYRRPNSFCNQAAPRQPELLYGFAAASAGAFNGILL